MTQYLLSVWADESTFADMSEADLQRAYSQVDVFNKELEASGSWVFAGGLHASRTATVVRSVNGEVTTTDGPFAETKEVLGGYYLLDAPDLDTVLAHATRVPNIAFGSTEVRPILDMGARQARVAEVQAQA